MPLCGSIVTFSYPREAGEGCELRLDIASPQWKPLAYILVSAEARAAFAVPPEELLIQQVCATGLVQLDKNKSLISS